MKYPSSFNTIKWTILSGLLFIGAQSFAQSSWDRYFEHDTLTDKHLCRSKG
jgi:hypothetical protein